MAIKEEKLFTVVLLVAMLTFIGFYRAQAAEPFEAGIRIGAYSNVYQSINDEQEDVYVSPVLSYSAATKPDANGLSWTFNGSADGYIYKKEDDMNSAALTVTPGLRYGFAKTWQLRVQPFAQLKTVKDSDQSAKSYGGSISVDNQWTREFSSGAYVRYLDSHAHERVYSADEYAVGLSADYSFTPEWYGSCWYEYAHGSNYQTATVASQSPGGWIWDRLSYLIKDDNGQQATVVISDTIKTHSFGLRTGYAWTPAILTELGYIHRKSDSDSGDVTSNEVTCGMYFRF